MSIEELLKNSGSPNWKGQRKRLLRVILGISISALALIVGAFILFSAKQKDIQKKNALVEKDEKEVDSLARLMRLNDEVKDLQKNIAPPIRREVASRKQKPRPTVGSAPRIINFDPGEGFSTVAGDRSDTYIPTGAVFQARLITPIKTSVDRTFVMAETTSEFRMDMKRRIPRGSRLIGRSRLNPILKGVIVEFETLVLPSGIETAINGLALSRNALPEIDGLYFSDHLQTYGTALAFGFLSGFADAAREREVTIFGTQPEIGISNQVLAGLSTASFQVAEEMLRDIRARAIEYVVVPAGEQIFVALTRRYVMVQSGGTK